MNLLETLLQAQGGSAVKQLAGQFGVNENQAASAVSALLPALSGGLQRNLQQPGGIESLLGALSQGRHERFLEQPETLGAPETIREGNGILSHLLGSKDVSRQVASHASAQTGLGEGLMKQMLPVVASMVMGAMSKQTASQGIHNAQAAPDGILGMLTPFLDSNKDGSIADDVLGMMGNLFRK